MQFGDKDRAYRDYLNNKVNPIIEPLMKMLLKNQPEDVHAYILDFVKKHRDNPNFLSQQQQQQQPQYQSQPQYQQRQEPPSSSRNQRSPEKEAYSPQKETHSPQKNKAKPAHSDSDDDDEEDDEVDEIPIAALQQKKNNPRISVSAEVYGKFNKKGDFQPRVIKKTPEQRKQILDKLSKAFMFAHLDKKEQDIIVDAMEEKKFRTGEWVIKQGDDGHELYVVDRGTLECYKQFSKNADPKHVKTYNPGESFGELALLYNAPRAASIKAAVDSVLFALDRDTFNNIVKDSIIKRREKFEGILSKIELLSTMDPYERSKIADVAIPVQFKAGDVVIKQGDQGDKFYFIEDGNAVATKTQPGRKDAEVVYNYSPGDYFGELALLKGDPRAANVVAKTSLSLLALDRVSFTRVLGPLTDLLKRNTKKYEKFM